MIKHIPVAISSASSRTSPPSSSLNPPPPPPPLPPPLPPPPVLFLLLDSQAHCRQCRVSGDELAYTCDDRSMRQQGRLKLDTSLFLCCSATLLPLDNGRGSLAPHLTLLACTPYTLHRCLASPPTSPHRASASLSSTSSSSSLCPYACMHVCMYVL